MATPRPHFTLPTTLNPYWLVGFTDAEGCFMLTEWKRKSSALSSFGLVLQITQHLRDEELLRLISTYLGCGRVKIRKTEQGLDFLATTQADVFDTIIPFFNKYNLKTVKLLNFLDFCKGLILLKVIFIVLNKVLQC